LIAADAISYTTVGPSPLMALIQDYMGLETAIYLMADTPELFAEVVELMHQDRLRELEAVLPHVAADSVWMIENTSTTLVSPSMFAQWCVPQLQEYGQMILDRGLIPVHHMCGKLNALLEMIDSLPAMANEAYTTGPVGDASLAEGRRRMPSKALIGGTNAADWLRSAEEIIEAVRRDLANCPDRRRIFLTSGGVLPTAVPLDKARFVAEELKQL